MTSQTVQQNWRPAQDEKALDEIGTCGFVFCDKPIHFGDRSIQKGDKFFCCEDHYVIETGARIVKAGTGEWTL